MSKKVLVLGEAREGALRNVSFEAIAAAKKISEAGKLSVYYLAIQFSHLAKK